MSKYEWERGTIVIPAGAWSTFRRGLIEKWNAEQDRLLALAVSVRTELEAAAKGKRGFDRAAWVGSRLSARDNDCDEVTRLLGLRPKLVDGKWVQATKTCAPRRKDLNLMPVSRGGTMDLGEASIHLDDAAHSVTWSVGNNNHAVESARDLPMARALFAALGRVEWKRGSGGKIVGNDEYNRDNDHEDGGGNYVTSEYGPDVAKRSTAPLSSWGRY